MWGRAPAPATLFSSQNFIKAKQYPPSTQVEVQNDWAESAVFQQLFQKWTVPNQTSGLGKTHTVGSVGEGWPEVGWGQESTGPASRLPSPKCLFHAHCYPGSGWGGDTEGLG